MGAFTVAMLALVYMSLFEKELIADGLSWLEARIQTWGKWNYAIAGVTAAIESFPLLGIVVPGMNVMLIVGGFFGAIGQTELMLMMFAAAVGAVLGNAVGYWLGVRYGYGFFKKYGEYTIGIGPVEYKYLQAAIAKKGVWFLVLGKWHNTTSCIVPFIAGSMGMRAGVFWLWNILGAVVWAVGIISLGVVSAKSWQNILDNSGWVGLMFIALVGGYIYFFQRAAFVRYWREKQAEIEARE